MNSYRLIDVSMDMEGFTFPGNPLFSAEGPFNRVPGDNPEFVYDLTFSTQTGTHIQGPHYFLEEGRRIDSFPLGAFEGMACVLDLSKRGEDTTVEDLRSLIRPGDRECPFVLFRTGHMEEVIRSGVLDPARRPGLSPEAARFLVREWGVRLIAIDSVGVESRASENYEVNRYLCESGLLILEGLVNLSTIRRRHVFLEAFPLKVRNVEGTPCRAVVKEPL